MKIVIQILFCLFIFISCGYDKSQTQILEKIEKSNNSIFEKKFNEKVISSFSKKQIIELSSNKNPEIALYFFQILVNKYPDDAYSVFLRNIDNKKISTIATSYDTLEEMTVSQAMLFYAILKQSIFTEEQLNEILDKIILDINNKRHLYGYLAMYLDKNKNNPDPKYYSILRKEILDTTSKPYFHNHAIINYFSNYNKPEDVIIIKDFIKKSVYDEPTYFNSGIEFIANSPKEQYFDILTDYFDKKIKDQKFRADDIFFELELYTKALTRYKSNESKELITEIVNKSNYYSQGNFLAPREQVYLLLENEDKKNYFSVLKQKLSQEVSKTKLDSIRKWNER
ncbi:hypothetical protein QGN23_03685 [Chryseobacterium gotjawalense]|uniref:Uncharacterized protein n=1 Tax=Chryseobacterium gotjawalense TaxID=3042315 RepID=A0ABY8RH70_9FLAO|nr:hypothetical protein [Chryseobacterium sp. wdc7]WHF52387.1 hypothetical protein QGN23_03685 [Chryseobacterium sp. wdc7]